MEVLSEWESRRISAAVLRAPTPSNSITVSDATLIFQYCAHRKELTESQLKAADVDGDGKVTVTDATWIFQYCAHKESQF